MFHRPSRPRRTGAFLSSEGLAGVGVLLWLLALILLVVRMAQGVS
jgi:hypothetical protein